MGNRQDWSFPGSRWWKCDLHTHTPASNGVDYVDKAASPADWVKAAVDAGLDAVAVTDHNDATWIDAVQAAAKDVGLVVFPGVEITASHGIHVLAVLPPGTSGHAVAALLGKCNVSPSEFGTMKAISSLSALDVARVIAEHKGVCIAAHVDGPDGLLAKLVTIGSDGSTSGDETLIRIVTSPNLHGAEVYKSDARLLAYLDNTKEGYRRSEGRLPWLESSDAHRLLDLGQRSTWIKMSKPDLEGLRLALTDAEMSVLRGSVVLADPNAHAGDVIESIEVERAQYMGNGAPLRVELNPWLNAIIGGHGTGKSTIVELLRIAMRREDEIPPALKGALSKYALVRKEREDPGLLRLDTALRVIYRRDGQRFRIQWSPDGSLPAIEQDDGGGGWTLAPGEVTSRFPVRIFSQKQIYNLAEEPNALLRIIDESPTVDAISVRAEMDREEKAFLSLRAQARAAAAETRDEPRLRGSLDDVKRKLAVFEASDHREVLRSYQIVERQQGAMDDWVAGFEGAVVRADEIARSLDVTDLVPGVFPDGASSGAAERAVLDAMDEVRAELAGIRAEAEALVARARAALAKFKSTASGGSWAAHLAEARSRYEDLKRQLTAAGAGDPSEYGRLVQEQQTLESRLRTLEARKEAVRTFEQQASERLTRLAALRTELTNRRQTFLAAVLVGNNRVRVEIIPYGDRHDAERRFREHIARTDQTFQDQIWSDDDDRGVLRDLYVNHPPERDAAGFTSELTGLKQRLTAIALGGDGGELHGKFVAHLRRLPPEALDRIAVLFPEDSVSLTYRTPAGGDFRPVSQGSPGQKSAAVLAFVLSHGTEPLILDQPEDDLDGQLIAELIVEQLRQAKVRRQIVVVTHDSNIVVNGDAEFVAPFVPRAGQSRIEGAGGLQEETVRDTICAVMEGGRDALERRYKRIGRGAGRA